MKETLVRKVGQLNWCERAEEETSAEGEGKWRTVIGQEVLSEETSLQKLLDDRQEVTVGIKTAL